jgi:hypothetical protein
MDRLLRHHLLAHHYVLPATGSLKPASRLKQRVASIGVSEALSRVVPWPGPAGDRAATRPQPSAGGRSLARLPLARPPRPGFSRAGPGGFQAVAAGR